MKNMKTMMKLAEGFLKKNDRKILTGCAVAGVFVTFGLAMKAGAKVSEVSKAKKQDLKDTDPADKATKKKVIMEGVKEAAPSVLAAGLMGAATVGAILGSHEKAERKIAGLTAAYTIAESSLKDLNKTMDEVVGSKKAREIKDKIVGENLKKEEPINAGNIVVTGNGNVLCRDMYTGVTFYSNAQKIGLVINQLSGRCASENYIRLNELYSELGIPTNGMGEDFGWNTDDMINHSLPITISAQLTEDQTPCLCLDYDVSMIRYFGR